MDQTVSRRSEPSSRTAFMGEQPNPWDVLPPQVAMSRHRGAKPSRRCELLGKISLFNFVITKTFKSLFLRVSKEFRLCHQLVSYLFLLQVAGHSWRGYWLHILTL